MSRVAHAGSRRERSPARSRRRWRLSIALALSGSSCLALFAAADALARREAVPIATLLRDTVAVLDAPFYVGIVSNVGIALWCAGTAICLFGASVARALGRAAVDTRFFFAAAAISAWLLADDALLLHEQVFPDYLGLPGRLTFVIAALAIGLFLIVFRRTLLASDYPILVAALGCFAASVAIDQLHDLHQLWRLGVHSGGLALVLEDGAKVLGIALWTSYFALAARDLVVDARPEPGP